jgi:hypothetical protein
MKDVRASTCKPKYLSVLSRYIATFLDSMRMELLGVTARDGAESVVFEDCPAVSVWCSDVVGEAVRFNREDDDDDDDDDEDCCRGGNSLNPCNGEEWFDPGGVGNLFMRGRLEKTASSVRRIAYILYDHKRGNDMRLTRLPKRDRMPLIDRHSPSPNAHRVVPSLSIPSIPLHNLLLVHSKVIIRMKIR